MLCCEAWVPSPDPKGPLLVLRKNRPGGITEMSNNCLERLWFTKTMSNHDDDGRAMWVSADVCVYHSACVKIRELLSELILSFCLGFWELNPGCQDNVSVHLARAKVLLFKV